MIPPWVLPESPETIRWLDDATQVFAPAFGRGMTQRGSMADPRWGLRRRYRGLRSDQKAAILQCLNESRGQFNKILVTPHAPLRGSFPATELLTNPTFASGTTGWSAFDSSATIAASDRVLRSTVAAHQANAFITAAQLNGLTQYAPYIARAFMFTGRGSPWSPVIAVGALAGNSDYFGNTDTTGQAVQGGIFKSSAGVVPATTAYFGAGATTEAGRIAGDYLNFLYTSFSRCAPVDNGPNYLLQSDELNPTWTATGATVAVQAATAPNASVTADAIVEDSSTGTHGIDQPVTVASAAGDFAFSVALQANTRTWVQLILREGTGSSDVSMYFNLSTGATGTGATGANWANRRVFVTPLGNGWYRCTIVARKTNAATQVRALIILATGDTANSYAGNGTSQIYAWRATLASSGVPTRLALTTTSAVTTGTVQTGSALYLKGLPASTDGLLEIGDWVEVAGQLKQVTARLNSDAAGLGYLQFRPALGDSPADNDPVIINQPFGRFIYSGGTKELENQFGLYGDIEMNLEEVYS
jgi:hypothetical protein